MNSTITSVSSRNDVMNQTLDKGRTLRGTPGALGSAGQHGRRSVRRAFTITEMLVVIVIFVILVLIAVPSFQGMLRSNEESQAENVLKQSIRGARDAALRSGVGVDSALVFIAGPEGRVSMVPYVKVGVLEDEDVSTATATTIEREIFVPAVGTPIFQLPKGWSVRAYASSTLRESGERGGWYTDQGGSGSFASRYESGGASAGNWVAPETRFIDADRSDRGDYRSTFMVRFEGSTGRVRSSPSRGALALVPAMSDIAVSGLPASLRTIRGTLSADPTRYVQRVLRVRVNATDTPAQAAQNRQSLIGRVSTDMVMVKPVAELVLYDERKLAGGVNARLDNDLLSIMQTVSGESGAELVTGVMAAGDVNRWIEAATNPAKLFVIDRYSSNLRQVKLQLESQ